MRSNPRALTLILSSVSMIILLSACGDDLLVPESVSPQYIKGGKPKPPADDTHGEVTLVTYTVAELGPGFTRGLTGDAAIDQQISAHLASEDPSVDWAAFLGCPDSSKPCSEVRLVLAGSKAVSFSATAVPIVAVCGGTLEETCLHETAIVNRRDGTVRGGSAIPRIPWDLVSQTFVPDAEGRPIFTFYWQGQRGSTAAWPTGETEKVRGKIRDVYDSGKHWDLFPDLHDQGNPDRFFFHPIFEVRDRLFHHPTFADTMLLRICDEGRCFAEYKGTADYTLSSVDWVEVTQIQVSGNDYLEFGVKATVDANPANTNPESHGRVMLTKNGTREMLHPLSTERIERADGSAATRYRIQVEPGVCHSFDLVGLVVTETQRDTFAEDNRWVWERTPLQSLQYGCNAGM